MVKLLGRLRKKKTSYVEVDKHLKVKDLFKEKKNAFKEKKKANNKNKSVKEVNKESSTRSMSTFQKGEIPWANNDNNNNNNDNSKSLKEVDREQLTSMSTRSMSRTFQKGEVPWKARIERNTPATAKPEQTKDVHAAIFKIGSKLATSQSTRNSRTSNKMVPPQVKKSNSFQATPGQNVRVFETLPTVRETSKPSKKPVNKFDDDALNATYDLIPTKVRNAPFGRCYFARHRESKNVVLIALILQHVFDRFEGEHGEEQLIELMKSADPNLRGLREKIQCSGSVALVMDITLSELSKSETMPIQNGARSSSPDPSITLRGDAKLAMDQRDEEEEIDDFMSELDSSEPSPWSPRTVSEAPKVDPRKNKVIDTDHFRKEAFSFESYDQVESREDKTSEKPSIVQSETRDPSGREEFLRGDAYVSDDSGERVGRSRNGRQLTRQARSMSASKRRTRQVDDDDDDENREEVDEIREMPEVSTRSRRSKLRRAQSADRKSEAKEKIRRRRQKELSQRRRGRTRSRGRERHVESRDSFSTNSSDTSVVLRPVPPKNLTLWKLLTSLELADCMPLAALDETMDFNFGRGGDESGRSTRGRGSIRRRNTFDTCESSAY